MAGNGPGSVHDVDEAACRALIRERDLVLVDFWAQWCGPCRSLTPVIDELAARHPALTVVKVDVEANGNLADVFDVRSVPSLLLFKEGQCVECQVGKVPYVHLERMVAKHV